MWLSVVAVDDTLLVASSGGDSRTVGVTGVVGSSADWPFICELSRFCERKTDQLRTGKTVLLESNCHTLFYTLFHS